ncbi:MAG: uracil-DNA glycosylase [Chloroflexaceae bacterium]|nr:uracil-DNA glycosylase [Chloroflexaceae bacterium]
MTGEKLQTIAQEVSACTRCPLHRGRFRAVPGEGPTSARIMFIGEGPGYHEDRQGRPFVGASGKFLDTLLALAGLQRAEVFIANVIKCRAPQDRDPLPEEIETCTTLYLFRQIEVINPRVIVTLGRFSMALYLPGEKISRIHGQPRTIGGRLVVPMMHPAAGLHQPKNRPLIEEDFRRLPEILARAEREEAAAHSDSDEGSASDSAQKEGDQSGGRPVGEQMSMF